MLAQLPTLGKELPGVQMEGRREQQSSTRCLVRLTWLLRYLTKIWGVSSSVK